jgi:hypothetical protein
MLLAGRNNLYPAPFDEFDPFHRISGKKSFSMKKTRAMQSKLNLEQPLDLYAELE